MRGLAAVVLSAGLAACATMPGVIAPPQRYQHLALPQGAHEVVMPAAIIEPFCNALMGDGRRYNGCYAGATRTVFRPTAWSEPMTARAVKVHEYAHAWGWPGSHPK